MKVIRNLPMLAEALKSLIPIRKIAVNIDRYHAAGEYEKEAEQICIAERNWGNQICSRFNIKLHVEGLEHIPQGPVVFVSNHQSYCDIPAIAAAIPGRGIDMGIGFVAKTELEKIPLYGRWIKRVRSVFIDRDDARSSLRAIEEGIQNLEKGFSMGIFPEGHRSKGDSMSEFKKGSLRLATKPGVPVVPITLSGTWKLYEAQGYLKSGEVSVYIRPAIETKDMPRKEASELASVVENIIRTKLLELQGK